MDAEKLVMIEKILKMLELGKDGNGAYTPEQEAANTMAAKMMAKYSIDFADLRNGRPKNHSFEQSNVDGLDETFCAWEGSLAGAIAKAFDCQVVLSKEPSFIMRFCGTKNDLEISVFFYRHLRRTVGRKSEMAHKGRKNQETFAFGMVTTISERLMDLYKRRDEVMDGDCRAMVLVKKDGLQDFVKDRFPNLRYGSPHRLSGSSEAYNGGKEAGRTVNLSRPIAGNKEGMRTIRGH